MATLPTLYPTSDAQVGTWTTDAGGTTNLWQKIEEGVATATDTNDFVRAPTGATNTTTDQYEANITDMPTDFGSMTTLSVNVRYNQTGRVDDTLQLLVRIESSAGIAYTNDVLITVSSTTFANTGVLAMGLTTAGTNATKTDWNNAYIVLSQIYTASMSNDNGRIQVSAIELTGTYSTQAPVAPATISATTTMPSASASAGATATPVVIVAVTSISAVTAVASIDTPTLGVGFFGEGSISTGGQQDFTDPPTVGTEVVGENAVGLTYQVNSTYAPTLATETFGTNALGKPPQVLPGTDPSINATAFPIVISSLITLNDPTETVSVTKATQPILTSALLPQPSTIVILYLNGSWGINAGLVQIINNTIILTTVSSTITLPSTTKSVTETRYATSNIANNGCTTPANANGANDGVFTANTGGSTWDARWAIGDPSNALSGTQNGTIYWKKDATAGNDPTATVELWENGTLVSTLINALTITDAISSSNFNFAASSITNRNNVEIRVAVTASGGTVSARRTVQVDAIGITFAQVA